MRRIKRHHIAAVAVLTALLFQVAEGQTPPSCEEAISALSAGSTDVSQWAGAADCPTEVGDALVAAMGHAEAASDTIYLSSLAAIASTVRDASVANAAKGLALNANATIQARLTGELIVMSQITPPLGLDIVSGWADMLAASPGQACFLEGMPSDWRVQNSVPSDFQSGLLDHLRNVAVDPAQPASLRHLADCAFGVRGIDHPVPVSSLSVEYVCERRFRVTNASSWPALVRYEYTDTGFSGTLDVAAESAFDLRIPQDGPLSVWSGDDLVGAVQNSSIPCP